MADILENTGRLIRKHRKAQQLSQQGLAEQAGISYKYLGEIERGQVNLSVEILVKLATALRVAPGDLIAMTTQDSDELLKAKGMLTGLSSRQLDTAMELMTTLKRHDAD